MERRFHLTDHDGVVLLDPLTRQSYGFTGDFSTLRRTSFFRIPISRNPISLNDYDYYLGPSEDVVDVEEATTPEGQMDVLVPIIRIGSREQWEAYAAEHQLNEDELNSITVEPYPQP